MAVIRFLLGDEHDIWFRKLGQMLDARWVGMPGEEEFRMPHRAWAGKPWIDKNGKGPTRSRRRSEGFQAGEWREGQEEGRIGIQMLDCHGHLAGWTRWRRVVGKVISLSGILHPAPRPHKILRSHRGSPCAKRKQRDMAKSRTTLLLN